MRLRELGIFFFFCKFSLQFSTVYNTANGRTHSYCSVSVSCALDITVRNRADVSFSLRCQYTRKYVVRTIKYTHNTTIYGTRCKNVNIGRVFLKKKKRKWGGSKKKKTTLIQMPCNCTAFGVKTEDYFRNPIPTPAVAFP